VKQLGCEFVSAPVSGNGKCVKAGKLSMVVSGPNSVFDEVQPYLKTIAASGVSYVGEGELARICKIAHNVFLGVVIQNLSEITILAQKAGVPRHAFLNFMNSSVLGSTFSKYKSNALVNLDWTTTFTPVLLRKDLDLGLKAARDLDVAMPVTAATREALQGHIGTATLKPDPAAYLEKDFAALLETVALAAGTKLSPENVPMPTGLETEG
jgi:3-hydroxyisobutyrate dehydrogenase